ncbi:MAG TPA: CheR family methyltransferase [Candidatus Dormibacteraeota bacterium]
MTLEAGPGFEELLEFLRNDRGFDFTGYKRQTLLRRVGRRAQQVGLDDFTEYMDYLQVHPDEFSILFNTILINVTEFFRDTAAWDYLSSEVIPQIVSKSDGDLIRIWSAACASGEEAYSAAIAACEAIGPDEFVRRVKVYATDVDEEALATARGGYTLDALSRLPEDLVQRYFDLQAGRYLFKPALRRAIIFGRHDLMQDAPISRVDLLICRNTLMYFTAESQARILARFHYALNDSGYLFLGRAEMLLTHSDLFVPTELKYHIFRKVPRVQLGERMVTVAQGGNSDTPELAGTRVQLRALAGEQLPVPEIVLDAGETLIAANHAARAAFKLAPTDIGKPIKDLELSYRPLELRSRIATALREHKPVLVNDVAHTAPDGPDGTVYDVHVVPLMAERNGLVVGISVTFHDVTEQRHLRSELDRVRQEVETANEELQSSYEELETTNEELQSTVEELETTNEELQSSNEELETMNEELESTNSELQAINTDLRTRTDQVDQLNTFLDAILASLQVGIVVLDAQFKVAMWNARSFDLWGVREEEAVGKVFFDLDIGLPLDQIEQMTRGVAAGTEKDAQRTVAAINRRGRTMRCRVSVTPLSAVSPSGKGVVVLVEEIAGNADPAS